MSTYGGFLVLLRSAYISESLTALALKSKKSRKRVPRLIWINSRIRCSTYSSASPPHGGDRKKRKRQCKKHRSYENLRFTNVCLCPYCGVFYVAEINLGKFMFPFYKATRILFHTLSRLCFQFPILVYTSLLTNYCLVFLPYLASAGGNILLSVWLV